MLTKEQEKSLKKLQRLQKIDTNPKDALLELAEAVDETTDVLFEHISDITDKVEMVEKQEGQKGEKGERGERGERGNDGKDGKDGKNGADGKDGLDGGDGLDGKDGEDGIGIDGKDGKMGAMPKHEWDNEYLRFQMTPTEWGKWVNLKGDKGYSGAGSRGGGHAKTPPATWGGITGTLSDQTDLQSALDAKLNISAFVPSGTDKMLQFNDGGVFGGAVEVYWNKTEKKMKMLTGSTFELYNTADITTNYERATLKYTSNQLQLTSEAGGTGVARGFLMNVPNGAFSLTNNITANTNKTGRFFIPHYNTSEEGGFVFGGTVTSTSYLLDIGGGTTSGNTITQGRLWAASNNTTLTGTQIATWDVSRFTHNSGMNYKVTRISSATHNVASNEHLLYVDYTATGAVTINLPAFASTRDGQEYVIADTGGNASVNNITITPAGSNTIGLAGSKVISTNGGCITIKGDNSKTNWIITSSV